MGVRVFIGDQDLGHSKCRGMMLSGFYGVEEASVCRGEDWDMMGGLCKEKERKQQLKQQPRAAELMSCLRRQRKGSCMICFQRTYMPLDKAKVSSILSHLLSSTVGVRLQTWGGDYGEGDPDRGQMPDRDGCSRSIR